MNINIGIVLNFKSAEKKKDELLEINSHEYLELANDTRYSDYTINRKGVRCVPADVAIGLYIESLPKNDKFNLVVDYIKPEEISLARFKKNDIVFVIIYDLLECFHLGSKTNFNKFKHALKNSGNVYPPYEYQKFVNNKCTYYKYLADKKIPVAPTHCITKHKWNTRDSDHYVDNLLSKIKNNEWDSVIAKPVYGQESKDFAKFMSKKECTSDSACSKQVCKSSLFCQKTRLKKYLSKNIPKYNSIIIQEYIPGFDRENPEIRTYFIDGIYAYSIVTTKTVVDRPIQEGGKYRISSENWNYIMKFSQRVMDSLPKLDLPGLHRNPILTRIDIGSGLHGVPKGYFVNEVEFVPSLYIEDQNFPIVEQIAHSLLFVAMEYRLAKSPIKVKF